ncbi:MAG: tetratricopeptide repeat protein [Opitutales bacterium]
MKLKHFLFPVLIALAATAAFILLYEAPASRDFPGLDSLLEQFSAPGEEHADPAICIDCHQEAAADWANSHHALANAPLGENDIERLTAAKGDLLSKRSISWKKRPDTVVMEENGVPDYPVVGSIGITPLIQYLHMAEDGRIQCQDVAWDVEKKEWFSVFERDDDPEDPRIPGEWGHWTGQGMNWDANCAYCHMTEYRKNYDPASNTYSRTWSHMAITCIQCHPKMDVHMEQVRNGNNEFKETLTPRQIMETCATCHSRRDQLTADGFKAGDLYEDHFQLTLADMEGLYHPDGQVIGENYVYGSLTMSKMGHAGVTCMDCHDPHTAEFILPVENNALCQRCHGSGLNDAPKIDPLAHSHHPAESTGNRCVECHMPHTYFMGRDPRRDHSFSHPDPRLNIELGIPDACSKCHDTQSLEWNMEQAEKWYGPDMNAERRTKARLMQDLWNGVEGAGDRLKQAIAGEKNRYWKSTLITMLQYIPSDQEAFEILHAGTTDPEPMVRAASIRLLGTENLSIEQRDAILNDPVRSVRLSAALSTPGMEGLPEQLEKELLEYTTHTADTPMGSLRLASLHAALGNREMALHLSRQAIDFEPHNPEAYRLAAIQLHGNGDTSGALDFLAQALRIDPDQQTVHFNLGLLKAELQDTDQAIYHLNRAVTIDPQYVDAWFNLIVIYWQIDQMSTARSKLADALEANPQSQRLIQLARQMPPENR